MIFVQILKTTSSKRYTFSFEFPIERFLDPKDEGELFTIAYKMHRKKAGKKSTLAVYKARKVHVQYARIVHQFSQEEYHGSVDHGHESLRRRSYVQEMLNEFGKELERYNGLDKDFRSKVLTPVLVRHMRGIPDVYAPTIRRAIKHGPGDPTLNEITKFYLGFDPLSPQAIYSYRRNLLLIREARWHLAVVMGKIAPSSRSKYNFTLASQDKIVEYFQTNQRPPGNPIPPLTEMEISVLLMEGIEGFFGPELAKVVRANV